MSDASRRVDSLAAETGKRRPPRSLRVRLLWVTLAGIAFGLLLTGLALTALFRDHVVNQFRAAMSRQLDQLIVELHFDAAGQPAINARAMLDPRLQRPYSGLYWQIDELPAAASPRLAVARSRSLWDARLDVPLPAAARGGRVVDSELRGPDNEELLVLQRIVSTPDAPGRSFRLIVAGDLRYNLEATERFGQALALALCLLFGLLGLAAWAQVSIGLRPLRALQQALREVRAGQATRIDGRFPDEVQPLVDDFNQVLAANAVVLERARTQAGNLAHALKTPLAVLENEVAHAAAHDTAMPLPLVREQLAQVRRQVDWHLKRARAAATGSLPGQQSDVGRAVEGLLRVLSRVFAERAIDVQLDAPARPLRFAGEAQDLQELLGNLLENAFKWARTRVRITLASLPAQGQLEVCIEDDGPGIDESQLQLVRERGVRLDESTPGSGLGLAIAQELVQHYRGSLVLENRSDQPGLRVRLHLPAVIAAAAGGTAPPP